MTGDMQGMLFGAISATPDDAAQARTAQRELRVRPLNAQHVTAAERTGHIVRTIGYPSSIRRL